MTVFLTRGRAGAGTAAPPPDPGAPGRLFVLMINGGGSREDNAQSHLGHLRELTAHLRAAGVPRERITILASDGADPTPDLATLREEPLEFWLLEGTWLARPLGEPLRFENSTVPGVTLLPATRPALSRALRASAAAMRAGDSLLVYVTDHGLDDRGDPLRNRITLWGARESINVRQLAGELAQLPPGVRVVTVMSQCFSGGFAHLPRALPARLQGAVCGYFASPEDRPAYGCFPESNRADRSGHGFTFVDALARKTRLPEVHAEILARDETPDVPLRTSDLWLRDWLDRAATRANVTPEALTDQLLAQTTPAPPPDAHAAQTLAAELARRFGAPAPLTVTALDRVMDELDELRDRIGEHQKLWQSALDDQVGAQLDAFLAVTPDWRPRLAPARLRQLPDDRRRALTTELLAALTAFADRDPPLRELLHKLLDRADDAAALAYRADVREAGLMRARILLTSAAAERHLAGRPLAAPAATPADRATLAGLRACEALELPHAPPRDPPPAGAPLPPAAADRAAAADLRPSWLGVAFGRPPPALVRRHALGPGAAHLTSVLPGSPAATAGLQRGDVVLGAQDRPFTRANQLRAFTMLAPRDRPISFAILRRGARQAVAVSLSPLPAR